MLARPEALDGLVAELARTHVLIRRLEWLVSPLESMYYAQTEERPAELAPRALAEPVRVPR